MQKVGRPWVVLINHVSIEYSASKGIGAVTGGIL